MRSFDNGKFGVVADKHVGPFLFNLRPGTVDYDAVHETWAEDVYRLADLPLEADADASQVRAEHPLVVDIGAHIGAVAIWCAMRGAYVHAYEASEENRNILAMHARRAGLHIHIWPEPVLAHANVAITEISGTGMSEVARSSEGELAVALSTVIDRAINSAVNATREIALLKIDVEGAEWEILADAATFATDCLVDVRNITIETHATDALTYGAALAYLSRTHHVEAFGSYEVGGMIHARRY